MSQKKAVEESTLELIKSLQSKPCLEGFYLAGGTALALYLGHRKSVDIDLFSNTGFDAAVLLEILQQDFPYRLFFTASNTLKGTINDVKVDILAHRYGLLGPPRLIDGVSVLTEPDIIAMKLNAISISGQRSKDFVDIFYLLPKYELKDMLGFYQEKYKQQNDTFILKSLIWFDDVDLADWPVMVDNPGLKWTDVKKRIEKAVLHYIKKR